MALDQIGKPADPLPPLRILCVDDNRDVADSEANLLQIVGFDARACYSGETALAEAARFLPAVCLIDFNMPDMGGDELAVRLRRELIHWPLILVAVTAMSSEKFQQLIQEAEFDMHLVKPVDPNSLISVVDSLWDKWHDLIIKTPPARSRDLKSELVDPSRV